MKYLPLLLVLSTAAVFAGERYSGSPLKDELSGKMRKGQKRLSYDRAREYIFGKLYLERDNSGYFIRGVYCDRIFHQQNRRNGKIGPMKVPSNRMMNVEHVWPQSKFNRHQSIQFQKSDLNHLLPVWAYANSKRGSHPFGEVEKTGVPVDSEKCSVSYVNNKTKQFEPADEIKGNVARMTFYFSVRYKLPIDDAQEAVLRKWHHDDPVDDHEREMADRIYQIQKNRNLFVVDPSLVDKVRDF